MRNVLQKLTHIRPSFRALVALWQEEFSFRLQIVLACVLLLLAFTFRISEVELLILILVIGGVLSMEALNTAIEELCDHVTPGQHPQIGKIKNLASSACGIMGTTATIVVAIIFIPRLFSIL